MKFYRAFPVLSGVRRYVACAFGAREKAVAEAEKWIARNALAGETWAVEIEGAYYA